MGRHIFLMSIDSFSWLNMVNSFCNFFSPRIQHNFDDFETSENCRDCVTWLYRFNMPVSQDHIALATAATIDIVMSIDHIRLNVQINYRPFNIWSIKDSKEGMNFNSSTKSITKIAIMNAFFFSFIYCNLFYLPSHSPNLQMIKI